MFALLSSAANDPNIITQLFSIRGAMLNVHSDYELIENMCRLRLCHRNIVYLSVSTLIEFSLAKFFPNHQIPQSTSAIKFEYYYSL